jgi:hypothetical protein
MLGCPESSAQANPHYGHHGALMERNVTALVFSLLLLLEIPAWAGGTGGANSCPKYLEKEAVDVVSTDIMNWATLHDAYLRFLPCDDGAIAEGFTDIVVRILAYRWASLGELRTIAKNDPGFLCFVYRHITSSADPHDLQQIQNNLKKHGCSKASRKVCREIELAVTQALEEVTEDK